MPGRLRGRKRKISSQSRSFAKVCPALRKSMDSSGHVSRSEIRSEMRSEIRSEISCECEQWSPERRCSASPPPRCDKENQQEAPCCGESMDWQDFSKTVFPDEDSNQVLPVEQFFGNMDTVQDFPQRTSAPSTSVQRAQRRRRYYAPEDSEDSEDREDHDWDSPEQRH